MENSREFAKQEFDRWVAAMDIDLSVVGDENDKRDKDGDVERIIRAIIDGRLIIEDDGVAVFTPKESDKHLRWDPPTGAAYTAMDRKKDSSQMAKMFASMAAITHVNEVTYVKMRLPDLKVCQAIWALFLA